MDKAPDAYRTISEVAEDLDLPQHVLRFWETRFAQIKPLKRGGGRRYYRPDDVELLKGIRHLLYKEGYTIKGVQRILKEQGARAVQSVARPPEPSDWEIADAPAAVAVHHRAEYESPPAPVRTAPPFEAPREPAPAPTPPPPASADFYVPVPSQSDDDPPEVPRWPAREPAAEQMMETELAKPAEMSAPAVSRPQVSMFRGGLSGGVASPEAISGEAEADFAMELREKLERERLAAVQASPAAPAFRPLPMPDQNQRAVLGAALEELLACKEVLRQLLQRQASAA